MQTFWPPLMWKKMLPGLLAAIIFISAIPTPARALIPGDICLFLGLAGTETVAAVTGAESISMAGLAASAGMLAVPSFDFWNAQQNALFSAPFVAETSVHERANTTKTCDDVLTTAILKTAINLVRDMTIRWISTGRFDAPVISAGYSVDIAKSAENASRTFLSRITGLNMCQGFGIPGIPAFSFSVNLGLSCTAETGQFGERRFINPMLYTEYDQYTDSLPANDYPQALVRLAQAKIEAEARAAAEKSADFMSGSGFLGTRDEKGNVITPGSAIAKLVMEQAIVSPIRQTDVANTTQQAIAAIIDAAIRTILEKGITAVSGG